MGPGAQPPGDAAPRPQRTDPLSGTLERVLRRDRRIVIAGAVLITALAWVYTVAEAGRMTAMPEISGPVASASVAAMMEPAFQAWSATDFGIMFVMWAVMMVAMMTPSATPLLLLHARIQRQRDPASAAPAATLAFAAGYLLVWTGFGLLATGLQWGLERLTLLSAGMMASTSPWLGVAFLMAAGGYQLSRYKETCLEHCRSPLHFISERWRRGAGGALRMGLEHGAYCIGCCWLLMLLLFVGGVMNLAWIAVLSIFVLLEKVLPRSEWASRVGAALMLAAGGWLLVRAVA